ncbi:MAG: hypothetical protein HOP08_00750 [Cyclobacteriaceae bacterium]|nr:hypothetical protein [Cyclobacteriaceae bacterium]
MKSRENIVDIICILYIILFMYASISKILQYSDFIIQLQKSPILVDISGFVSWSIPAVEILIALLLVFQTTRQIGLYASFGLMMLFTFYIISILGYSEYVPCSCGGILQSLGWTEHLFFNIAFCLLGVAAIVLQSKRKRTSIVFIASITLSTLIIVFVLFRLTYQDNEKYSSFNIRSFSASIGQRDSVNLGFNSYYFAGKGNHLLFLGNETAPQIVTTFNPATRALDARAITYDGALSSNSRLSVNTDHFYLHDGTIPVILFGRMDDLIAEPSKLTYRHFTDMVPLSPTTYAFRISDKSGKQQLAITRLDSGLSIKPNILREQVDGRFDVDGKLFFDEKNKKIGYVYLYRNQFLELDSALHLLAIRNTIDTVRTAKIKVSTVEQGNKISSVVIPTLTVNLHASTGSDLLLIQSNIRAKNQTKEEFENSIRLDVYHFLKGVYLASINIPMEDKSTFRDLIVFETDLYLLIGNSLIRYDMADILLECKTLSSQRNFTGQ